MTADEIVAQLKPLGTDTYKKMLLNHGISEPVFGVKIEELKKIQKKIKMDYRLALDLYDTGIYDAMYLAGLIADDLKMTRRDLQHWVEKASSATLSQYTVPWVAAESMHGRELALEWIESNSESVASSGWATLSGLVAIRTDADLDLLELEQLLRRVQRTIHQQPNRVRSAMNAFVIALGNHVAALTERCKTAGKRIGKVSVNMGDTACKVPSIVEYIEKAEKMGRIGQKKKELGLTFDAAALMNASAANSQSRNHFLGSLRNMLPTLEKLECPNLIVLSGDQVPGLSRAQQHAACVETLLRAAELVDKTPYSLLLENIDPEENPKYFLTSVVEGFEIIRKVGHPRVRFLYDLFHEQIAEGNLITKLEKNIDLVGLIHVADVPGRHEPGTGEINFANVYTTLARLNYNRYVAMEFEPLGDPVAALRTAREMALAPNR